MNFEQKTNICHLNLAKSEFWSSVLLEANLCHLHFSVLLLMS